MLDPETKQPSEIDENTDDTFDENYESSSSEDIREELADLYLNFLDTKKEGVLSVTAKLGFSINPFKEEAKRYLLGEEKINGFLGKVGKKIKEKLLKEIISGTVLEYNKDNLDKMKKLILQNKDDKTKLKKFMDEIEQGIDPTQVSVVDDQTDKFPVVPPVVSEQKENKTSKYIFPFINKAKLTSPFGKRDYHPITGEPDDHIGIDLSIEEGTPILSMCDGTVTANEKTDLGGRQITVKDATGKKFYYLHMKDQSPLNVGTVINAGDEIGKVGSTGSSTGPHLHLTIKEKDHPVDPVTLFPELFSEQHLA